MSRAKLGAKSIDVIDAYGWTLRASREGDRVSVMLVDNCGDQIGGIGPAPRAVVRDFLIQVLELVR